MGMGCIAIEVCSAKLAYSPKEYGLYEHYKNFELLAKFVLRFCE